MSKPILDALKSRLYASTALMTAVGNRIYLNTAPANASLPLIVYRVESVTTTPHFGGITRYDLSVEFNFFYSNSGGQDIHSTADLLEAALATPLTVTGFDRARFVRSSAGVPSFSDDSWTMIETYKVVAFDT